MYDRYITKRELLKAVRKTVPNVNFNVSQNTDRFYEACTQYVKNSKNNSIEKVEILLPFSSKYYDAIFANKLNVIAHEFRHFFDAVTHPKTMVIASKLSKSKINDSCLDLYELKVYKKEDTSNNPKKDIIKSLKDIVLGSFSEKNYTAEEKILALNYIRGNLESEKNAYSQGIFIAEQPAFSVAKQKIRKGKNVTIKLKNGLIYKSKDFKNKHEKIKELNKINILNYKDIYQKQCSEFMFKDKLKMINSILKDILMAEKKNIEKNITK